MNQAELDLLVLAAQNGNHRAFDLLVRHFHKSLVSFAVKMSKDVDLSHDAVQESWIKIAKNIRKLKDPRAFKSWIYRLVRWRILDLLKIRNRELLRTEAVDENLLTDPHSEHSDDKDEASSLISQLPDTEREIIHLFYLDELRITEISIVLEIPIGTVKSRLNRARNLLREKYNNLEN